MIMNFMFVTLFNKIPLCIFKQNTLVNALVRNGQPVSNIKKQSTTKSSIFNTNQIA